MKMFLNLFLRALFFLGLGFDSLFGSYSRELIGAKTLTKDEVKFLKAISRGDEKIVTSLLDEETVTGNTSSHLGRPVLHMALTQRNPKIGIVKKLLEKGARVNVSFMGGNALLWLSESENSSNRDFFQQAFSLLLLYGLDLNAKNENDCTGFFLIAKLYDKDLLKQCFENGGNPNLLSKGDTVLHYYVKEGFFHWDKKKFQDVWIFLWSTRGCNYKFPVDFRVKNKKGKNLLFSALASWNSSLFPDLLKRIKPSQGTEAEVNEWAEWLKCLPIALPKALKEAREEREKMRSSSV